MADKWIHVSSSARGRLHRALGVPEGESIPESKLQAALHSNRKFEGSSVAAMAREAVNLKGLHKGSKSDFEEKVTKK